MKRMQYAAILILLGAILALLVVLRSAHSDEPVLDSSYRPEVNTEGLCWVKVVAEESKYELYYTAEDAEVIAKTVWGEARGCSPEGQAKVVWAILNRVDSNKFPNTIQGVVTQPNQFFGYSASFPVTPEILAVVNDVLSRWNAEKNGIAVTRELGNTYLWFTGDGNQNYFRKEY